MADIEELLLWRRLWWDPPPPWIKLNEEQMRKFAAVELRLNAKINEIQNQMRTEIQKIEAQKLAEFEKIAGITRG
jgi:hypothetical protein